jgi:hypothetical protein
MERKPMCRRKEEGSWEREEGKVAELAPHGGERVIEEELRSQRAWSGTSGPMNSPT